MFERIVVINVTRFGLFGPRLLLPEAEWLQPLASWIVYAPTVESDGNVGRGWKYLFSGSAYPVTSSFLDRKSTRLNSSHCVTSRMPSSA